MSGAARVPASLLASYLRDTLKFSFVPDVGHVDRMYEAALALEELDALRATTAKLREALTELLDARGTSLNIVGHDPVSGHPLSREGMAALKARTALALPTPSVQP